MGALREAYSRSLSLLAARSRVWLLELDPSSQRLEMEQREVRGFQRRRCKGEPSGLKDRCSEKQALGSNLSLNPSFAIDWLHGLGVSVSYCCNNAA